MYTIHFDPEAVEEMARYKRSNPMLYKKLVKLLEDIADHPRTGLGHPEPLKGGGNVTYSRRISGQHRIIYEVHDTTITVLVLSVYGHYGDK